MTPSILLRGVSYTCSRMFSTHNHNQSNCLQRCVVVYVFVHYYVFYKHISSNAHCYLLIVSERLALLKKLCQLILNTILYIFKESLIGGDSLSYFIIFMIMKCWLGSSVVKCCTPEICTFTGSNIQTR